MQAKTEALQAKTQSLQAELRDRLAADAIVNRALGTAAAPQAAESAAYDDEGGTVRRHRHLRLIRGGLGAAAGAVVLSALRWARQQPIQAGLAAAAAATVAATTGTLAAGWTPPDVGSGGDTADAGPRYVVTAPAAAEDSTEAVAEAPELETVGDVGPLPGEGDGDSRLPDPVQGSNPGSGSGALPDPGLGAGSPPSSGTSPPPPGPDPDPEPVPSPSPEPEPEPDPGPPDEDEPGCSLLPLLDLIRCLVPIL